MNVQNYKLVQKLVKDYMKVEEMICHFAMRESTLYLWL